MTPARPGSDHGRGGQGGREPRATVQAQARKDVIFPLKANSMCALRRQRDEHKSPTLGIFKPGVIKRLRIKPSAADWPGSRGRRNTSSLV